MGYQEFKSELKKLKDQRKDKQYRRSELFALRAKFVEEAKECIRCGRNEMLTVDHIIPASVLQQLGVDMEQDDDEENWQILCNPCNHFKAARLDFTNPKTKE